MRIIDIEAVTCVVASDGAWRDPGDRWACPADEAERLLASGAARLFEGPAAAGAAPDPAAGDDLTRISGVGPATAADLRKAGVETLAQLAALTDAQVAGLAVDEGAKRRLLGDWRDQARLFAARDLGGPEPPAL